MIEDVQNAVAAGKIVTISQSMIHYKGWTGTGYVLLDPKTGAGAYLIGGGMDGAWIATVIVGLILVLGGAAVIGGAIFAATAAGVAANALIGVSLIGLLSSYTGLSAIFMAINVKTRDSISCNLMKLFWGSAAGASITIGGLILGAVSNLVGAVVSESIDQTVAAGIGAFTLQCPSDRG